MFYGPILQETFAFSEMPTIRSCLFIRLLYEKASDVHSYTITVRGSFYLHKQQNNVVSTSLQYKHSRSGTKSISCNSLLVITLLCTNSN